MSYPSTEQAGPEADPPELVECQLSSGRRVITSQASCDANGSTLGPDLSNDMSNLVRCELPGDGVVVITLNSCIAHGGTVLEKENPMPPPAAEAG